MANDALLRLKSVSKHFGSVVGLRGIDLAIAEGEFLSLLGPSGCGKTTMLRIIAGFEAPTEGRLYLDGRDITPLRAFDRPVNTVFQDYALFPHMSVAENVGFGLSLRKIAGGELRRRVAAALEMVGLADKIDQRIQALSGGQRQRVALARAIVCEPRCFCSTSRFRHSMRICASRCRWSSSACSASSAPPSSWLPMTRPRRCRFPIASW